MSSEREFPKPPENKHDAASQARYLAGLLQAGMGLVLTEQTILDIRRYLYRVGPENYEDLIASIFLECWQEQKPSTPLTDVAVRRAADRVRQRLVRSVRREVATDRSEVVPSAALPPDDEVALVLREFQTFLKQRPGHDALLFQRYYLDGNRDIPSLADELGLSTATVYRKLKTIQDDFKALRELKEPKESG